MRGREKERQRVGVSNKEIQGVMVSRRKGQWKTKKCSGRDRKAKIKRKAERERERERKKRKRERERERERKKEKEERERAD